MPKYPDVLPHQEIRKIFPDVYCVTGSVRMKPAFQCSRNMVIIREGNELSLINAVRLSDEGLKALDGLGRVKHVLRIAWFHGMDDPFYIDRYHAKYWSLPPGRSNFKTKPDIPLSENTDLPFNNAQIFQFKTTQKPEAVILLNREGGIVITGDSILNITDTKFGFNLFSKVAMRFLGFIKPAICSWALFIIGLP